MTTRNVLNHWKIIHAKDAGNGQYVACIEGRVASSNPRFPQASIIRTSYLTAYEIDGDAFIVITARRSEYVLGTRNTAEFLSEEFLKSFLPERRMAPTPSQFDGVGSQVIAFRQDDDQGDSSYSAYTQTQLSEDRR